MPRKNNQNSFNHVMVRGHHKQNIFLSDNDYEKSCQLLEYVVTKCNCKIHLYCLMSNHIHLLIETNEIPLHRIMQIFLASYAKYFNKTNQREGYLFQGRYKAKPVQSKNYYIELIHYIHHNPLKAGIVQTLDLYPWSSHFSYAKIMPKKWVTTSFSINLLRKNFFSYEVFINSYELINDISEYSEFDTNNPLWKNQMNILYRNKNLSGLHILNFKDISNIICDYLNINPAELVSVSYKRELCRARSIICYFAHFYGYVAINFIATQFECHEKSLSLTMYKYINKLENQHLIKRIETIFIHKLAEKSIS